MVQEFLIATAVVAVLHFLRFYSEHENFDSWKEREERKGVDAKASC